MALSPAQICNLALFRIGEKQVIDALSDSSEQAQACNVVYAPSVDYVLEEYWWPFATRRAVLGVLAKSPTEAAARTGWGYTYAVPTDCLMPRYIEVGIHRPGADQEIPFELEDDAVNGRVLITDKQTAELVYTRAVTETGKFSPMFCDALAWKIAAELCFAIPVNPGAGERMMQGYQFAVAKAAASTARHSTPAPPARPAAIRVR